MKRYILYFLLLIMFAACRSNKKDVVKIFEFSINTIAKKNDSVCKIEKSDSYGKEVLVYHPAEENESIEISGVDQKVNWSDVKYLICEVYHSLNCNAILSFNFYKKKSADDSGIGQKDNQEVNKKPTPRISPEIGILPFIKTKIVLPLTYLDGQTVSGERYPGQLTTFILGHRLEPNEIGELRLGLTTPYQSPDIQPEIEIAAIYLTNELPETYTDLDKPVVDKLGQWNYKDWQGKVKNENQLQENMLKLENDVADAQYPEDWSKYGGWKQKQFKATGFFRTQFDGRRWWFVDPDGYAFVCNGIDCITTSMECAVYKGKNESFFEWLPKGADTVAFKDAIRKRSETTSFNFYISNLIRVYGSEWRKHWEKITVGIMKKLRINSIANWSDIDFAQRAKRSYLFPLRGFPGTRKLLYRDFPDVFSDEYHENATQYARQLEPFKDDPYLIGYFLSNEPKWAFGSTVYAFDKTFNLAYEMFATSEPSFTKKTFIAWLKERYKNNLWEFNKEWNLQLADFKELESKIINRSMLTAVSEKDMKEFSNQMMDKYLKVVCDEVKKVDPNHLNLGMRYAWVSNELLYNTGAYFDVFSLNAYYFTPPNTSEIYKRVGKPVMIGEFHFGSIDRGLPHPGLKGVANQSARGDAYSYYMEQGFARPEIVGINFFQWLDEPVNGRYDGENFNIGVIDVCNQQYKELAASIKATNERLYKVADGKLKAFNKLVGKDN